jgi:hypothetical protein
MPRPPWPPDFSVPDLEETSISIEKAQTARQ